MKCGTLLLCGVYSNVCVCMTLIREIYPIFSTLRKALIVIIYMKLIKSSALGLGLFMPSCFILWIIRIRGGSVFVEFVGTPHPRIYSLNETKRSKNFIKH